MIRKIVDGYAPIIYRVCSLEGVSNMIAEHFMDRHDRLVTINTSIDDYAEMDGRGELDGLVVTYYNMEHKCKIDSRGQLPFVGEYWTSLNNEMFGKYDEIWDFQIEDYEFFKFHGFGDKFRFKPLRYTNWYEQFRADVAPHYDIQFECIVDSDIRKTAMECLTGLPLCVDGDGNYHITGEYAKINMTNTFDCKVKLEAKNHCRYGVDFPRFDYPCTHNTFRIFEYVCMNKPVLVWNRYDITSKLYFGDLCVYMDNFTAYDINNAINETPRTDIAKSFKQMTYSDSDYDKYRLDIVRDYADRTGMVVPDSVLW